MRVLCCQVIFSLYGGQVTPSLFNFCIISEAVFYCSAAVCINLRVKQLLAFFQCFLLELRVDAAQVAMVV